MPNQKGSIVANLPSYQKVVRGLNKAAGNPPLVEIPGGTFQQKVPVDVFIN